MAVVALCLVKCLEQIIIH